MIWIIVFLLWVIGVASIQTETEKVPAMSFGTAVVVLALYMLTFSYSVSTNAELRAFAAQNHQVYVEVVELTKVMETGGPSASNITLVNGKSWEEVKIAADRLKEARDSVVEYNSLLWSKREYASHWFLRMWIAEPPAELEFIDLPSKS